MVFIKSLTLVKLGNISLYRKTQLKHNDAMHSLKMLLNSSFQEMKDELGQVWSSLNSSEKDLQAMWIAINTTEQELTQRVCNVFSTVCMISVSFHTQQNYKLRPKILILNHRHWSQSPTPPPSSFAWEVVFLLMRGQRNSHEKLTELPQNLGFSINPADLYWIEKEYPNRKHTYRTIKSGTAHLRVRDPKFSNINKG